MVIAFVLVASEFCLPGDELETVFVNLTPVYDLLFIGLWIFWNCLSVLDSFLSISIQQSNHFAKEQH